MKNLRLVLLLTMILLACNKQEMQHITTNANETSNYKFFPKVDNIPDHKQNEVTVRFKPGSEKRLLRKHTMYREINPAGMKGMKTQVQPSYEIRVQDEMSALHVFRNDPDVEYASLNTTHTIQGFVPNDPQYTSGGQWNLAAIEAEKAWASGNTGKKDVYIVVLDEGSAQWFCDLFGKHWGNQAEINGIDGVDDDQNGYVDDKQGWNWFNGSNQMYTGNNDHGTWCESMIGGKSGNGIGIASVAPNIKLISLKFLSDYGYDNDAAKAIYYTIWLKQHLGLNIVAISNSWGGGGFNQFLKEAIHEAGLNEINMVFAGGNDGVNTPTYPAAYDEPCIISVGASDEANTKVYFSHWGLDPVTGVDIFAPGVRCAAIIPVNHQEAIGIYSGTSMAAPLIAAAIGLIASVNPEMTAAQRKDALIAAGKDVPALHPYCISGKMLNLNNSVYFGNTDPVVPDATCGTPPVLDLTPPSTMHITLDSVKEDAVNGKAYLYISWVPPTDNSEIIGLDFRLTPYETWFFQGNAWRGAVFDVTMDRLYNISGRGVDSWGNYGIPSNVITKDYSGSPPPTDNIPPTTPQNLRATNITTNSFDAAWNPSTDNVGVKNYKVHWRPKGQSFWTMTFTAFTSYKPIDLQSNTLYEFAVIAFDNAGNPSDTSTIEVLTSGGIADTQAPTLNGSPTLSNITTSSIKVNWPAASDNVAVTGYDIYRDGVKLNGSNITGTSYTDNGLSPATTYSYYYTAHDAVPNISVNSATVTARTESLPPPPEFTITIALSGDATQSFPVNLTSTITTNGVVASKQMERRRANETAFTTISNNPANPFIDDDRVLKSNGNPNWVYRLKVTLSNGQWAYSNEKPVKVNKK